MGFLTQWLWCLLAYSVGSGVTWAITLSWLEPEGEDDA